MNAASTVKSVQMELMSTLRVMVCNVTKYTGSSWQKYILSLSTSLDIQYVLKKTLIKKTKYWFNFFCSHKSEKAQVLIKSINIIYFFI